jgi:hypothetical protein
VGDGLQGVYTPIAHRGGSYKDNKIRMGNKNMGPSNFTGHDQ